MSSDPPEETEAQPEPPRRSRWRGLWWQLGLLVIAAISLTGVNRAEKHVKDPHFCESCHTKALGQVHASVHKQLLCTACHEAKTGQDLHQWGLGLFSSTKTTPHGKLDPARCKSCHMRGTDEPWQIAKTNGHVDHISKADKPLACSACHTWQEHKSAPKPSSCPECHKKVETYGAHGVEGHRKIPCLACHNYLAEVGNGTLTPAYYCQRCHGGVKNPEPTSRFSEVIPAKAIDSSMIHGNLKTCALCHQPHEKEKAKRLRGEDCTLCHAKVTTEFHNTKMPDRFTCMTCHKPHGPRTSLVTACANCHDKKTEPGTTASAHQRCSQCHKSHEFKADVDGCRDCHADKALVLASWNAQTHDDCTNCHKPHVVEKPASLCMGCHKGKQAHSHPACTTCHDPHKDASQAKSCGGCHGSEMTTLARSVPQHRASTCRTCHNPHAPRAALSGCKACHTKEVQLVATAPPPKHKLCLSCHKPHTFAATVTACSGCHHNPTTGAHTGACARCHEVHGPPIGQKTACANCHADKAPQGKHSKCTTCHKAAHGPELKAPLCGTCHTDKAAGVAAWKPPTHQACTNCHEKHNPTNPKTCNQCHLKETKQIGPPQHKCTSCHEIHKAPTAFWNACTKCHTSQVSAVRGRGPTHSNCSSCHKPHAFTPPTCASCHSSLQAAHQIHKAKAKCTDCHDTHARKMPTRSDCLKCHQNKTDHYPNAQNCAACHLFKAAK